jgi:hypothetical protein
MSLFHRLEVGIGGTRSLWNQPEQGLLFQNGPALLNIKGVLFPLLRNPLPDTEFTFGLHLQQQLRIPKFDGPNDLGTLSPLTALRAVADKPFWRMGITGSLGFLLTQGRTDSELAASVRLHIPGMSRATVQGFGVLQGLFGSSRTAPLRGGIGLSVHFAWDNGTSLSGGYCTVRGEGAAPSAIYLGGPDYHIGRETSRAVLFPSADSQSRNGSVSVAVALGQAATGVERSRTSPRSPSPRRRLAKRRVFPVRGRKVRSPPSSLRKARCKSGKFCEAVGGKFVPWTSRCARSAGIWFRQQLRKHHHRQHLRCLRPPFHRQHTPSSPAQPPQDQRTFPPPTGEGQGGGLPRRGMGGEAKSKSSPIRKEVPKEETQVSSLNDEAPRSAPPTNPQSRFKTPPLENPPKQFAKGFAHGVGEESLQSTTTPKNSRPSSPKTGRELAEDISQVRS